MGFNSGFKGLKCALFNFAQKWLLIKTNKHEITYGPRSDFHLLLAFSLGHSSCISVTHLKYVSISQSQSISNET